MSIQLQNFVSLTTTGTSGASTLTNGVLNVPNYATGGGGTWVDYSATSTIVGWSSFTTKIIKYLVSGKQVFYIVNISGTSTNSSVSFTLAHTSIRQADVIGYGINNGAPVNCLAETPVSGSTTTCFSNLGGWTGTGTKSVYVQFFIDIL